MALELGVLVADPTLIGLACAVVAEECPAPSEAQIFLMDEGVRAAGDGDLAALLDAGCEVALCAMDAEARGVAPVDGGPRFGSQHDHATMIRDARRVLAMTGVLITRDEIHVDSHTPPPGRRRVAVRLTRDARHPKSAQALRAAVGYAATGLDVIVQLEPPARALVEHLDHPPQVLRALGTLRGLGHAIIVVAAGAAATPSAGVTVTW